MQRGNEVVLSSEDRKDATSFASPGFSGLVFTTYFLRYKDIVVDPKNPQGGEAQLAHIVSILVTCCWYIFVRNVLCFPWTAWG